MSDFLEQRGAKESVLPCRLIVGQRSKPNRIRSSIRYMTKIHRILKGTLVLIR